MDASVWAGKYRVSWMERIIECHVGRVTGRFTLFSITAVIHCEVIHPLTPLIYLLKAQVINTRGSRTHSLTHRCTNCIVLTERQRVLSPSQMQSLSQPRGQDPSSSVSSISSSSQDSKERLLVLNKARTDPYLWREAIKTNTLLLSWKNREHFGGQALEWY